MHVICSCWQLQAHAQGNMATNALAARVHCVYLITLIQSLFAFPCLPLMPQLSAGVLLPFHYNVHFMSSRCCLLLVVGSRLGLWLYLTSLLVAALSVFVLLRVFLQRQGENISELCKCTESSRLMLTAANLAQKPASVVQQQQI